MTANEHPALNASPTDQPEDNPAMSPDPACKRPAQPHVHADCTNPHRTSVRIVCADCSGLTLYGSRCPDCAARRAVQS